MALEHIYIYIKKLPPPPQQKEMGLAIYSTLAYLDIKYSLMALQNLVMGAELHWFVP